jgi:hypothetical protein
MDIARTQHLIVFTRYPEPGRVKTRLAPALGAVGAATLQRQLTEHILQISQAFVQAHGADLTVYFTGGPVGRMQQVFGAGFRYQPQASGDLGRRMFLAGADCLQSGSNRVVLMGSDCPGITAATLEEAFLALGDHDLVLGPARDGGYYLIGLKALHPELFQGIAWGTGVVLEETRRRAERSGLQVALLETLTDIDRPEDLPVWEHINQQAVYE